MAAARVTQCPPWCRSPRLRHPRVLPRKARVLGKGSRRRCPGIAASCARPDSSGHRVPGWTGPDMPKPSSAQRQGTEGSGAAVSGSAGSGTTGLQGTGGEPRTPAAALPRPRRPRSRRSSSGAPSRLSRPPQPLPGSRIGRERRRGSGTAARAAPTLPPESGVEHSASPRGANEEDVAATAPPTSERGTAGRPASGHARLGAQQGGRGSGSRRARLLPPPPYPP